MTRWVAIKRDPVLNKLSPTEINDLVDTFVTEDKDEEKTWARLFVERHLENVRICFVFDC